MSRLYNNGIINYGPLQTTNDSWTTITQIDLTSVCTSTFNGYNFLITCNYIIIARRPTDMASAIWQQMLGVKYVVSSATASVISNLPPIAIGKDIALLLTDTRVRTSAQYLYLDVKGLIANNINWDAQIEWNLGDDDL